MPPLFCCLRNVLLFLCYMTKNQREVLNCPFKGPCLSQEQGVPSRRNMVFPLCMSRKRALASPPLIRTPVLWDEGLTLTTSFQDPSPNAVTSGVRPSFFPAFPHSFLCPLQVCTEQLLCARRIEKNLSRTYSALIMGLTVHGGDRTYKGKHRVYCQLVLCVSKEK